MAYKEKNLFRLGHIIDCIEKIEYISTEINIKIFLEDWIRQDAMIRNFEIIGEASIHISEDLKEKYPEIEWRKMKGMRNFMAHEYFGIRLETIYNTAIIDIPKLKLQIEEIILEIEK